MELPDWNHVPGPIDSGIGPTTPVRLATAGRSRVSWGVGRGAGRLGGMGPWVVQTEGSENHGQ